MPPSGSRAPSGPRSLGRAGTQFVPMVDRSVARPSDWYFRWSLWGSATRRVQSDGPAVRGWLRHRSAGAAGGSGRRGRCAVMGQETSCDGPSVGWGDPARFRDLWCRVPRTSFFMADLLLEVLDRRERSVDAPET